jgi:2'-5' RNA ligase
VSSSATLEGDARLRLFIALVLPDRVSRSLLAWGREHLERGSGSAGGHRLLEHFHLTLAFLGTRPRSELEGILGVLRTEAARTQPFALEIRRYRETRSVGMLVLDDPTRGATGLAERLHAGLEELGVLQLGSHRREARPWLPHVTVLRFRERPRLDPPVDPLRTEVGAFAPSEAAAFLSRLHRTGARYEALERCQLKQPDVREGG